jgi:hypothetical protein
MICGYDTRTVNEYGLREMCEVSITAKPVLLRSLAKLMEDAASEMESAGAAVIHPNWHRHLPDALKRELGYDVIVCVAESMAPRC